MKAVAEHKKMMERFIKGCELNGKVAPIIYITNGTVT
jgi:hypothetical protein